jgi:hypothetical protein
VLITTALSWSESTIILRAISLDNGYLQIKKKNLTKNVTIQKTKLKLLCSPQHTVGKNIRGDFCCKNLY